VLVVVDVVVAAIVVPHVVLEVEVGLPGATVVLDIVGKGGAFDEGVVSLMFGELGIVLLQVGEGLEGLFQRVGAVSDQLVLSDVGQEKVAVNRPSTN